MITLREVEENDLISLAELLPKMGHLFTGTTKETWLRRFGIWWASNPAFTSQTPRGWVLENETTLVGFIGSVPVKFLVGGEVRTAVAAVDWFVAPSVRGIFSISLFKEYLNQKSASLFLFNLGDTKITKTLLKYKFGEYTVPLTQTEYFYILNRKKVDFIIRRFLFFGKVPKLNEILGFFTRIGMLIYAYVYQKPVTRYDDPLKKEYTTSLCTFCDDSFERIWEPHLDTCDVSLSRDIKTLNWLYFSPFKPNKRVVIQCRRSHDNSLAGYMVFDIMPYKSSEMEIMQLKDICIDDNNSQVLESLLSFAIEIGEQSKAALLVLWANSHELDMYLRRTFLMRRSAQYYRYIRLSDTLGVNSDSLKVCPSFIAPPHGIEHI